MAIDGIYTLANDVVYDQVVALINSIEVHLGTEIPICIIPYDDRLDRVRQEIARRPHVFVLDAPERIERWQDFVSQVWKLHPTAMETWEKRRGTPGVDRLGAHNRLCAFDTESPFERFIYLDADMLVFDNFDKVIPYLDRYDFIAYDFQRSNPENIYDLKSPRLNSLFESDSDMRSQVFCSGFFASKRGIIGPEQRQKILDNLASGDAEVLFPGSVDQSILNYSVAKLKISYCNLSWELPNEEKTGNSAHSPHFQNRDNVLYDRGKRLTFLHYIGVSSKYFNRACAGENIDFPYRDLFLHYRYLHEPEKRPKFTSPPQYYKQPPTFLDKVLKKLKLKT